MTAPPIGLCHPPWYLCARGTTRVSFDIGHGVHTSINDRCRRWGSIPPSCLPHRRRRGSKPEQRSGFTAAARARAENTRPMMARSSGVSEEGATRASQDHDAVCTFRSGESARDGAPAASFLPETSGMPHAPFPWVSRMCNIGRM